MSRSAAPLATRSSATWALLAIVATTVAVWVFPAGPFTPDASPPPAVPDDPGSVLWHADFEDGKLGPWALVSDQGDPSRLAVVADPRGNEKIARFTTHDTPDGDPRTQLNAPVTHGDGDEVYVRWRTLFPEDFPSLQGWLAFFDFHGPPYQGSPPITFAADHDRLRLRRHDAYGFDSIWDVPLERGRWHEFVVHVGFSQDPAQGFVELWYNGRQQQFRDGQYRIHYSTLMPGQDRVAAQWANYRQRGIAPIVTLFHDDVAVW